MPSILLILQFGAFNIMHFKRDGKSPCIGDLLIQKALEGKKVRILVWSLPGDIQTFSEANLGNKPRLFG